MVISYVENPVCIVCGGYKQRILGRRGNREYLGANSLLTPHIYTNVVKCGSCSFIFCNPAIRGHEYIESDHYNNPEIYNAYLLNNIFSVFKIGEKLIKKLKPTGKLLDIGAGKGDFVLLSQRNGYDAKGIEPSKRFCEYALEKYGVNIEQGYLGEKDFFRGEVFDIITLFHVLEHVPYPQALLANILNYLKEDGVVYIEVPNANSTLLKITDLVFRISGKDWSSRLSPLHAPFHSLGYSPKSLKCLLELNGFELVFIDTFSGKVRGYDTNGRISSFIRLAMNILINLVNLFPNKELISVIAKKRL